MSKLWIADSGSTKTDWRFCENGAERLRIATSGINPVYQTGEEIAVIVQQVLSEHLSASAPLYFYGAGVMDAEKTEWLRSILSPFFTGMVEVHSDMIGAARGLCGYSAGIACILGTGSNSCFYDGSAIRCNVPPLGFILGDEGSGAVIGKLFIGSLLKNLLPEELKQHFVERYPYSVPEIIDRVYRKPFPNRFLASFMPFILEQMHYEAVRKLVENAVSAFFVRNVLQYETALYPVHFTGSVAYGLRELLQQMATKCGIQLGTITPSPMEGLIRYHFNYE